LAAVAVLDDVGDGRASAAAVPRGHQPVEWGDEQVLPLVPDRGEAELIGRPGLGNGVFGVRAGAERLADHDPPGQFAIAEKITPAAARLAANPQAEDGDADEVNRQHRAIEPRKTGFHNRARG
jgi:hypothetical protein